jgi:hypothetical protein
MDVHISVLRARIRVRVMGVRWFRERGCPFRIWSLCSFIHLGSMALAYADWNPSKNSCSN